VPGVQVNISWPSGEDTLFTGFKPDIDPGYGDFQMAPGQVYEISLAGVKTTGQNPTVNINNQNLCPNQNDGKLPSWQLVFQQGASR